MQQVVLWQAWWFPAWFVHCQLNRSGATPWAKEYINSAHSLAVEATYNIQNFSQQLLQHNGEKVTFDDPSPFATEGEEVASVAYRYRRWKLDDETSLVARCEVHAVNVDPREERQFVTLSALNEFEFKITRQTEVNITKIPSYIHVLMSNILPHVKKVVCCTLDH
jgi:hypothetical protein